MKKTIYMLLAVCLMMAIPALGAKKKVEIPILAWYSIPPGEYATLEHYQELRDCGFTHSFSHIYNYDDAVKALDLCAAVGLKSIFMCTELERAPEETVRKVHKHRGLGGYFLRDEPSNEAMPGLGEWARKIESVDKEHPCYLNLLPTHAFPNAETYKEHLDRFCKEVHLPQISYDHYPIVSDGKSTWLNGRFYENLELVSTKAKQEGLPFWAFALATAHASYPIPPIAHLRLQMYSNLAYGAQLLQYFTYWCPGTETWDFHQAPITQDGKRSVTYNVVRDMNREIQSRAFVWAGCMVLDVAHLGNQIPEGAHALAAVPSCFSKLELRSGSALMSQLKNGDHQYVMLVNTSPVSQAQINIETAEKVQLIQRDGSREEAQKYESLYILEPGDCVIFEI